MSKHQQTPAQPLKPSVNGAAPHINKWLSAREICVSRAVKLCWPLVLLVRLTTSCSEEQANYQSAEQPVGQVTTDPETTPASDETIADNTVASTEQVPGAGSRYRITAETAYFFEEPQQGKPSSKYLLRGDVIYGEQESNGFIKTRFKNPNGATVIGWLKEQELSKLAVGSAPVTARNSRPANASAPHDTYESEQASSAPVEATEADAAGNTTAVVQAARSYFYNSPELTQPRKAHCVRGDKVQLGESRGDAVFVTFTNWEKVTTTGWMRKDALH
ncbi:hypothetical protein [Hymenobacter sp.]|jgi:hypothetical protein|uniref:hypothetical protein n=1 Tax=Hymenobacter sp. TaxID=1898978 RepID=UPI002EDB802D